MVHHTSYFLQQSRWRRSFSWCSFQAWLQPRSTSRTHSSTTPPWARIRTFSTRPGKSWSGAGNISDSHFHVRDLMHHNGPVSLFIVTRPTDKARLRPLIRILLNMIVRLLADRIEF